ncbi:uncharacterized protein LOC134769412 [Penaeus indicus]|uniref:uncharacterized protein LOC134769412 n=1 Tax=Penaeus indicus TaxID=29960 RepID=UPI00300C2593
MYRQVKLPKPKPPADFADCFDVDTPQPTFGDNVASWFNDAVHHARLKHHARKGSADSNYSQPSSDLSLDEERENLRRETERQALSQLEKARCGYAVSSLRMVKSDPK